MTNKYLKKSLRTWLNCPLPEEEAEQVFARFCAAFRRSHHRDRVSTKAEWDEFYRLPCDGEIFKHPVVAAETHLYLICGGVRLAPIAELNPLPRDFNFSDAFMFPPDYSWCLCRTEMHDEYWLKDLLGRFTDLGVPFRCEDLDDGAPPLPQE